ncbi:hypothetical protein HC891_07310, partial [Candidatus Gracilibacteria bacterium]|nr:hypothetical protein [Candidatus Gracilibacteria bacterium]
MPARSPRSPPNKRRQAWIWAREHRRLRAENIVGGDQVGQQFGDDATIGVAVGNDVHGGVLAPLFQGDATGTTIAGVINVYGQQTASGQADYRAALRRYLEQLYVWHATLDLRGIDQRQMDMPLSEIYVSLTLHEALPAETTGRGGLRRFIEQVRRRVRKEEATLTTRERAATWAEVLRAPRLAVIGLPGSGKTTLLHYTAIRLCEVLARDAQQPLLDLGLDDAATRAAPPVPVWLPLRELGAYLGESRQRELSGANSGLLLECLRNYYNNEGLDLPADFFSKLCQEGRAILLLDGLDEVPHTADRVLVSAIVQKFVQRYPQCRYVLTSRPKAYEGDARLGQGFHECVVNDLDAEQQQRFLANWSRSLHRLLGYRGAERDQQAHSFSTQLWDALEANQRVRDLATNPLLLTIIAIIYYDSRSLPENRAELYDACVTVLLKGGRGKIGAAARQREQYGVIPALPMSLHQKRELLAYAAYHMHVRGDDEQSATGREIHRDDLEAILRGAPALPSGVAAAE